MYIEIDSEVVGESNDYINPNGIVTPGIRVELDGDVISETNENDIGARLTEFNSRLRTHEHLFGGK